MTAQNITSQSQYSKLIFHHSQSVSIYPSKSKCINYVTVAVHTSSFVSQIAYIFFSVCFRRGAKDSADDCENAGDVVGSADIPLLVPSYDIDEGGHVWQRKADGSKEAHLGVSACRIF